MRLAAVAIANSCKRCLALSKCQRGRADHCCFVAGSFNVHCVRYAWPVVCDRQLAVAKQWCGAGARVESSNAAVAAASRVSDQPSSDLRLPFMLATHHQPM